MIIDNTDFEPENGVFAVEPKLRLRLGVKGSASSGNWGHAGRPGKLGGSLPRGAAMSIATGRDWQQRQHLKVVMAARVMPAEGFASGQAAQDWANKAYPETQFNLAAGGQTAITPTLRAYNDVAQKYPEVAKSIKIVELGRTPADTIINVSRDHSRLVLNQNWFSGRASASKDQGNAAELRAETRAAVKAGFYPAGAGVGHYMLHTYGTEVMHWIGNNPAANATLVTWLNQNFSKARSVSILATTGKTEFFGELFGALHGTNSTNPLVKDFGQMLEHVTGFSRAGGLS